MRAKAELLSYQQRATEFVLRTPNCAVYADVGLGKTAIALTAFSSMYDNFSARRALVVAPLRVARKGWRDEAAVWEHTKNLHVASITGDPKQRMKALRTPADLHTINFENLDWLEAQFIQHGKQVMRWPWDTVIVDEAHRVKSQSTVRWKVLRKLRRLYPSMVQLTATPSPNGYGDLWGMLYLLDQGKRLGATEQAFRDRWFDPPGFGDFGRWTLKEHAKNEIHDALQDIVFALREEDYLDLPPVRYDPVRIELQPQQQKLYREFQRKLILETTGGTLTAANAAVLQQKLLQLANGVVYVGKERAVTEIHGEKLGALEELLDDLGDKQVLIAYYFKHDLERLKYLLERRAKTEGKMWRVLRTEQDEDDWNAGKIDWMLIHPDSAGEGVNLHRSSCEHIIWYGLTNDLLKWQQLNGRIFGGHRRVGKAGVVHAIVADGTVDDDYRDLLDMKDGWQSGLMAALSQRAAAATGGTARG